MHMNYPLIVKHTTPKLQGDRRVMCLRPDKNLGIVKHTTDSDNS